jgi:sulfite reductase (NADPH) flavoprotein alpha-component
MTAEHKQAFHGRHLVNVRLTGPQSEKITRHHEISLGGSGVTYAPGDALGALPANDPALVDDILRALGASGDEPVPTPGGGTTPIGKALTSIYNITVPTRRLIEKMATMGGADLRPLLDKTNAEPLKHYLAAWNEAHDVLDVLTEHPHIRLTPVEFIETLRKMLPRLYSVASSLRAHPDAVHLLVVSVRYCVRGRERQGVCSTWLAERWEVGTTAELYLQNQQKHFAMPASSDTPMIMIGPGTGLAPFRAFIEERRAQGASGRNWLFFGEQRRASDFFYEDELTGYERDGLLRLDLAFSRDQAHKVYVQHRMRERGRDLWAWLENGAEIFVCGDKERMAADVDRELHAIAETHGGLSPEHAHHYVEHLRSTKRYKRDVY